jgi:hypothetical protein
MSVVCGVDDVNTVCCKGGTGAAVVTVVATAVVVANGVGGVVDVAVVVFADFFECQKPNRRFFDGRAAFFSVLAAFFAAFFAAAVLRFAVLRCVFSVFRCANYDKKQ